MIRRRLDELYEQYGYRKFRMSKFEPYDLYAENRDFLKSSQIITFTDLDGSLLALKPDITISIVKANPGKGEKVYYRETVYRPKDRHYREISQAGVECLGRIDAYKEAELIALAAKSLELYGHRFVIRVSDAAFLKEFFHAGGFSPEEEASVLSCFSSRNAKELDVFLEARQVDADVSGRLRSLMELYMPFREGVDAAERLALSDEGRRMAGHLRSLCGILDNFSVLPFVTLDFSLATSMDYYNGIIFQGAVEGIPFPVLSGGRYDKLPEKMGKSLEAIGFALYLDHLENYLESPKHYDVDCLLVYKDGDSPELIAKAVEGIVSQGKKVCAVSSGGDIRAKDIITLDEMLGQLRESGAG